MYNATKVVYNRMQVATLSIVFNTILIIKNVF